MEKDHLLPKGPQPYGNSSGKYVNENYQSRQNVYNQGSVRNYDYEPIPQSPPMVVQTGGLFNSHHILDDNNIQGPQRVPSDYSGYAWLSLLFCCFPLALAAIYQSDKVMKCIRKGDLEEAWRHSVAAKKLSALAVIYGILFIIAALTLYFVISTEVTHTL